MTRRARKCACEVSAGAPLLLRCRGVRTFALVRDAMLKRRSNALRGSVSAAPGLRCTAFATGARRLGASMRASLMQGARAGPPLCPRQREAQVRAYAGDDPGGSRWCLGALFLPFDSCTSRTPCDNLRAPARNSREMNGSFQICVPRSNSSISMVAICAHACVGCTPVLRAAQLHARRARSLACLAGALCRHCLLHQDALGASEYRC